MILERAVRVDVSDGTSVEVEPELSECFRVSKEDLFAGSNVCVWQIVNVDILVLINLRVLPISIA